MTTVRGDLPAKRPLRRTALIAAGALDAGAFVIAGGCRGTFELVSDADDPDDDDPGEMEPGLGEDDGNAFFFIC